MRSSELLYPQLVHCEVTVRGSGGISRPPVRLSATCLSAAQELKLPQKYDFETEKRVMERLENGGNPPAKKDPPSGGGGDMFTKTFSKIKKFW